jgi:hypothetical protein
MGRQRLDLTLPASIADFPRNRRGIAPSGWPRLKLDAAFRTSNARMSNELFSYSVRANSLRDGPASSTRDFAVGVQDSPFRAYGEQWQIP